MKVYQQTATGMEEAKSVNLPLNSRVYSFGAGMQDATWAVIPGNKLVKMSTLYHGEYFSTPYQPIDQYIRPVSKKFGIGFYYDDSDLDFRFSDEQIEEAVKKADAWIIEEKRLETEKKEQKEHTRQAMPEKYPHLTPITDQYNDKEIKKNLVADLKHNFPGVKFSVRKEHYDTYTVSWTNGPTQDAVDEVAKKFESYETDFTGDFRDPAPSCFNDVFGGFKYVFTHRNFSPEIESLFTGDCDQNRLIREACDIELPEKIKDVSFDGKELTFTAELKTATRAKSLEVIDYSEKAIAVTGDTKPIKDVLKSIGGRFNPRLSCGAGWIFPKTKKELVLQTLDI